MDTSKDIHYHDSIASEYDQVVLEPRELATQSLFAPALRRLAGHAPFAQMLDIGCGTGHMVLRAGHLAHKITGIDHSPGMLQIAKQRADAIGLSRAHFIERDVASFLDQSPDFADLTTAVGVLHHLGAENLDRILASIFRTTRPGGWVLLAEPVADGPIEEPEAIQQWNRKSLAASRHYASSAPDPDEAPLPPALLRNAITDAGFVPVIERRRWEIYNHSASPGFIERLRIERLQRRHAATGFIYACLARKPSLA